MAWNGPPGSLSLYYAIPDNTGGASRLYFADPTNGNAGFTQGQPWGRRAICPPAQSINNGLITAAKAASGQTKFDDNPPAPNPAVTVSFQTKQIGQGTNGVIHFVANHNGFGVKPSVSVNQALLPNTVDMSVDMNLDPQQADATVTFADTTNTTDISFVAGSARPGAQGNNILITFVRANLNGQGPSLTFLPFNQNGGIDKITVTLDTSPYRGTDPQVPQSQIGTSAFQLAKLLNSTIFTGGNLYSNILSVRDRKSTRLNSSHRT